MEQDDPNIGMEQVNNSGATGYPAETPPDIREPIEPHPSAPPIQPEIKEDYSRKRKNHENLRNALPAAPVPSAPPMDMELEAEEVTPSDSRQGESPRVEEEERQGEEKEGTGRSGWSISNWLGWSDSKTQENKKKRQESKGNSGNFGNPDCAEGSSDHVHHGFQEDLEALRQYYQESKEVKYVGECPICMEDIVWNGLGFRPGLKLGLVRARAGVGQGLGLG
eukprot:430585-Amorphochlora_amoeboformis.AAC.2